MPKFVCKVCPKKTKDVPCILELKEDMRTDVYPTICPFNVTDNPKWEVYVRK